MNDQLPSKLENEATRFAQITGNDINVELVRQAWEACCWFLISQMQSATDLPDAIRILKETLGYQEPATPNDAA